MAITTRQTILLKGDPGEGYKEYIAAENNILPGFLLQTDGNGEAITNNEAAKRAEVLVALEDDFRGMNIDGVSRDASTTGYQIGDIVRCKLLERGEVAYMILKSGEVVLKGGYLTSNADGKLQAAGASEYWMFKAVDAADATAADVRVAAECL